MSGFAVSQSSPLSTPPDLVVGAPQPVPFWDAVERGYTAQTEVLNTAAREEETRTEYWARHRALEKQTGKKLTPSRFMLNAERQDDYLAERLGGTSQGPLVSDGMDDAEYEKLVGSMGAESATALRARVDQRLKAIVARDADASQSGTGGTVGSLVGHIGGAMTDLPNIAALPLGAASGGRTLLGKMLFQGAVNAGVEAATAPARISDAEKFGGPEFGLDEAAADVGGAFVGGALLQGVGEGLGAAAKPLIRRMGWAEGTAAKRAAEQLERADLDDQAVGPRSGAEHEAAVASLDRHELPPLSPDQDITELPAQPGWLTPSDYRGRPIYGGSFDPRELQADPVRFQYKADGDGEGVTQRLKGVEAWDATASGKVIVWEDRAGQRFVADGHQRRGLALRMEEAGWNARLDGYLLKEADGWSAKDARIVAALKNIREGSGAPLDAAKVLREAPEAITDRSLPVSGDYMAQARGLAQLSEPAFKATVNKVIPERYAAEIGQMAGHRPDLHEAMVKLVKEAEPANADEARALVVEALQDDWIKREGDQADLFGYDPSVSAMIARAKVAAAVKRALAKDAKLFNQLVKNADAIEAGGNALARDANEARLAVDRAALEVTSKLALRAGPIGEAMQAAVAKVHAGEAAATAARDVLSRVREAIAAGERLDDLRGVALDPPAPSPAAVARLADFDAPTGKGAEGQTKVAPEDAELTAAPKVKERPESVDPDEFAAAAERNVAGIRQALQETEAAIAKAQKVRDTRGQGQQFHGARGPVESLSEGYYSPDNIYGGYDTFYTTDAADIAKGYGRKNPNAMLYEVTEREPVTFYDMEEPRTEAEWNTLFHVEDDSMGPEGEAIETAVHDNGGKANLRQVMDEIRAVSRDYDYSKDDVQLIFDGVSQNLQEQGFGGMQHTGGLRTNREPHLVKIYFRPWAQLELKAVEVPYDPPPAALLSQQQELTGALRDAEATLAAAKKDAEPPPGLFDDLVADERHANGLDLLAACVPAE